MAELAFWVCGLPPPERGEDVGWGGTGAAATLSTGAGPVRPGIAAVVGRVTGRDEKPAAIAAACAFAAGHVCVHVRLTEYA